MYIGTFKRDRIKEDPDGFKYWISKNEFNEDYYEKRNNKTQKWVLITNPDNDVVCGIDTEGRFSFNDAYKVYFLDDIPYWVDLDFYTYDGNVFMPYIDIKVWKYNMLLEIKDEMLEAFMNGEQRPDLVEKKRIVESYEGDGYNPTLPFIPKCDK